MSGLPATVLALAADSDSPVIYAHDGNLNMGVSGNIRTLRMFENVRITQGTMVIQGDEAILQYRVDTNELMRVTVHGSPVNYEQQISDEGELVTGNSDTIEFFTDETGDTIIEMIGNASIRSSDSSTSCQSITYLSDQNLIREAAGPCSGALSQQGN
ncbi:MAG: LptA/OstA family protein [Gammaproteobacteria bacterium]